MVTKLTQNIKHNTQYNPGGIQELCLIDAKNFVGYQFKGDGLYTECFVESLRLSNTDYIHLDVVTGTSFSEKKSGDVYEQELTTFVRTIDHQKTANLLQADANKYIVILRTYDNRAFTFGADTGASFSFTQQTGQLGDSTGYDITLSKRSIYPLFEIDTTMPVSKGKIFDRFFDQFFN